MKGLAMRILLLAQCRPLGWVIARLCPPGVEVEIVDSFRGARRSIEHRRPGAVVFDVTISSGPWKELARACEQGVPPIPYRWLAAADELSDSGSLPAGWEERSIPSRHDVEGLRAALECLIVEAVEVSADSPSRPAGEGDGRADPPEPSEEETRDGSSVVLHAG